MLLVVEPPHPGDRGGSVVDGGPELGHVLQGLAQVAQLAGCGLGAAFPELGREGRDSLGGCGQLGLRLGQRILELLSH